MSHDASDSMLADGCNTSSERPLGDAEWENEIARSILNLYTAKVLVERQQQHAGNETNRNEARSSLGGATCLADQNAQHDKNLSARSLETLLLPNLSSSIKNTGKKLTSLDPFRAHPSRLKSKIKQSASQGSHSPSAPSVIAVEIPKRAQHIW